MYNRTHSLLIHHHRHSPSTDVYYKHYKLTSIMSLIHYILLSIRSISKITEQQSVWQLTLHYHAHHNTLTDYHSYRVHYTWHKSTSHHNTLTDYHSYRVHYTWHKSTTTSYHNTLTDYHSYRVHYTWHKSTTTSHHNTLTDCSQGHKG